MSLLFVVFAGSCATDDPVSASPPVVIPEDAIDMTGLAEVTIDVKDNAFVQRIIVVTEGTVITWTNGGINPHNVTPSIDDSFMEIPTSALDAGMSATRTFGAGGEYPYFCSLHGTKRRGQNGVVIVVPAA